MNDTVDTRFVWQLEFDGKVKDKDSILKVVHTRRISFATKYGYICTASKLPQLTGLTDTNFQRRVNDLLLSNVRGWFAESMKYNAIKNFQEVLRDAYTQGGSEHIGFDSIPATGYADCKFQYYSPSIVTIVQTFGDEPAGGGNGWGCGVVSTCIDIRNSRVLSPEDFGLSIRDTARINRCLLRYFKRKFPDDCQVEGCNKIADSLDFAALSLQPWQGVLYLYREAYPSAHYSHTIYRIPLWKLSDYFSSGSYTQRPERVIKRQHPYGHFSFYYLTPTDKMM